MYLLLGYGLSNQAAQKYLIEQGINYLIYDDHLDYLQPQIDFSKVSLVIKSPGIMNNHKIIIEAKKRKIEIITDIELFFRAYPFQQYITITGSNGKTTTVTLLDKIFSQAKKPYFLSGNVGIPIFNFRPQNENLLVEASSFMLEYINKYHPHIACILNLTCAHLDFHETFENYFQAKQNILKNQTKNDFLVYNEDDKNVKELIKISKAIKVPFSKIKVVDGAYSIGKHLYFKDEYILSTDDILLLGKHNIDNILASIAISKILNINNDVIIDVVRKFPGIEHRIEYVGKMQGKKVYNDSKSTNLLALKNALLSFENNNVLLICGGKYRDDDFTILDGITSNVNKVLVFGENKHVFSQYFAKQNIPTFIFNNLDEVMKFLHEINIFEDIILFSPGSSSQDQFKNYEERGRKFKSYVL